MSEYKFGEMVKAKLGELKMSQSMLGKRVDKGRSYINYVVSGKNSTAKSNQSRPGPRIVEKIARELGIPTDEAFTAAGWPQYVGKSIIAGEAADANSRGVKVVKGQGAGSCDDGGIRIELSDDMHLILVNSGSELTDDEIDRYRLAFTTAAEVVQRLG